MWSVIDNMDFFVIAVRKQASTMIIFHSPTHY